MNETVVVNDEEGTVTLSKELYESLVEDEYFLLRLDGAGVDNWSGYEYALEDDYDGRSYQDALTEWKRGRGLTGTV